jgi:hypothetical protein
MWHSTAIAGKHDWRDIMTLTIKNPTVAKLACRLAALTGESKTEVVHKALMERSQRFYRDYVQREHRYEMRNSLLSSSQPPNGRKHRGTRLSQAEVVELLEFGPI